MISSDLSELGRAALDYIELGFAIIPLKPRSKAPNVRNGLNDWTDDAETVSNWWLKHPNDNIGIVCGTVSGGLFVLDFDVDEEKGKDGLKTLNDWERQYGELPATATAITGSGGIHYLYRVDRASFHPSVNATLGVDTRTDGAYIVAPPSIHPNGNRYEWQDYPDEVGITAATGRVYDFIDYVSRNGGQAGINSERFQKFKLPDTIKKGERDTTLFKFACSLREYGKSDDEILAMVAGANALKCTVPLDSRDIKRIVRSACKYEKGEERDSGAKDGAAGTKSKNKQSAPQDGLHSARGTILTNKVGRKLIEEYHACSIDGTPAVWTGSRWDFGKNAIGRATVALVDEAKNQDVNEVYGYIMRRAEARTSDDFDGRYYVQFKNCTYDVMAEVEVKPQPTMFITNTIPVNLNYGVKQNLADTFLDNISGSDPEVKTVLCEIIGACMCSKRVLNQSPMLIGRGGGARGKASNGKSTYLNWLRRILGSDNTSSLDIATLGKRFQQARVVGKLANLGDDIPDEFLRGNDLALFKRLVTGDAIYTDVKGGDGFEFRPSATFVFSMNEIPRLSDTTEGVFRRLAFVPFRAHFDPREGNYDGAIGHKLAAPEVLERGALLGLLALHKLIERGTLSNIADMVVEIENVKATNDTVLYWIEDENITADLIVGHDTASVYDMYTAWANRAGERYQVKRQTFTRRLQEIEVPYQGGVAYLGLQQITTQAGTKPRVYKILQTSR